jgi:hypothetical protein
MSDVADSAGEQQDGPRAGRAAIDERLRAVDVYIRGQITALDGDVVAFLPSRRDVFFEILRLIAEPACAPVIAAPVQTLPALHPATDDPGAAAAATGRMDTAAFAEFIAGAAAGECAVYWRGGPVDSRHPGVAQAALAAYFAGDCDLVQRRTTDGFEYIARRRPRRAGAGFVNIPSRPAV